MSPKLHTHLHKRAISLCPGGADGHRLRPLCCDRGHLTVLGFPLPPTGWGFVCCLQSSIRSRERLSVGWGSLKKFLCHVPSISLRLSLSVSLPPQRELSRSFSLCRCLSVSVSLSQFLPLLFLAKVSERWCKEAVAVDDVYGRCSLSCL